MPDGVEVFARAWTLDGKQIGFGKNGTVDIEEFRIVNPPILIPDVNGDVLRTRTVTEGSSSTPIDVIKTRKYRADPSGVLLKVLKQTLDVKKQKFGDNRIIRGKIGNTTLTVYPVAGTGTAPIDGNVGRNGRNETFATIRSGAGLSHTDIAATQNAPVLKGSTTANQWKNLYRGGWGFDTSSIGTDTIDSATFSVYVQNVATGVGSTDADLVSFSPASESDFVNADYALANFGSTRFATGVDIGTASTAAYNDWILNASGIAYINKTANTFFGMMSKWDLDNNFTGTWASGGTTALVLSWADTAGTTEDPRLVVEHSVAAAPARRRQAPPIIIGQ